MTAATDAAERRRWEAERMAMSVRFRIVMYENVPGEFPGDASGETLPKGVKTVLDDAFAKVGRLARSLNDYSAKSELNRVFRDAAPGTPMPVSADLAAVLARAAVIADETDGAFDPTVGVLTRRWRQSQRGRPLPTSEEIDALRVRVDRDAWVVDPAEPSVTVARSDLLLDLGGIAKGYACDAALAVLRGHGVRSALVEGGGDLAVGDPPPGTDGWSVEIEGGETLTVANCGVATSGSTYRFQIVDGVKRSHVIDPRTGYGVTTPGTVTVIADDGATADAWASAESVRGTDGVVDRRTP
ncbi:MAG: FAD:protein FMN transferase, partial [Planctomycetota bacterium]